MNKEQRTYETPTGALISENDYNFLPDHQKKQCVLYTHKEVSDKQGEESELRLAVKELLRWNAHLPKAADEDIERVLNALVPAAAVSAPVEDWISVEDRLPE